jgi:ParB family chromosome partitioning protein
MEMTVIQSAEYRDLPLALLSESITNPRRVFEDEALKELAASIRAQGVLSPLLVRPLDERGFEIIAGARRYRAAQMAQLVTVPVRIVNLNNADTLVAQLIENLMRRDVHPMEEASGFRALLNLEEPKYSIEQISAKTGKSPMYVASRLKLTELAPAAVEAFYKDEIGVGHALLLAKLQPDQQEKALAACFKEDWSGGSQARRILLPVRNLQSWIEQNVLLILKDAPFNKRDAELVPDAGSCVECPKRTGHNKLLFAEVSRQDACSDPRCFSSKVEAHIQKTLVEKPKLVQISTAYGVQRQDSPVLPRNKYVAIRQEKPANKQESTRPEFKTCKFTTEAIVSEGSEKGEIQKVCANPACPIHHAKRPDQHRTDDAKWKAEQEKRRREEAIANATGIRILSAIAAAVPVRLMKRDLLFVAEKLAVMLDQPRLEIAARQSGIKKSKASESVEKLFLAFLRRADEGTVGKLLVEIAILLAASRRDSAQTLSNAAEVYKVDVEAIRQKVRQEFTARQKATQQKGPATTKPQAKARKTA